MAPREIVTRRKLPHWYVPGAVHFVTYRLAGTIPIAVIARLRARRDSRLNQPPPNGISRGLFRQQLHKEFFAAYDRYLDQSKTLLLLAKPTVAAMIRRNLYHHDGTLYHLLAFCIMPNHVHVLLQPKEGQARPLVPTEDENLSDELPDKRSPLSTVMHSLKSYTAHQANVLLQRTGQFWQHESYDHWVRDDDELERIIYYIMWNPVKAKLVAQPHEWLFSSAHDRFLSDGSTAGFLIPCDQ